MIRTFGRIAAAVALLLGTVAVATVATNSDAGAANTNITGTCGGSGSPQSINNSDTITFTVGANCQQVMLGVGALGTAVLNGFGSLTPGTPIGAQPGDTVIYTAPASGASTDVFYFLINFQPSINYQITFPIPPPRNDSLTANGDGSLTVTYSPVVSPQALSLNLFAPGTTCDPTGNPTNRLFGISNFSNQGLPVFAASPAVLSVGSPMRSGWANTTVASTLTAGSYQACLYYYNGNQQNTLVQSLAVTIGTVTPTTAPAGDPVTPAFTG